MNSLVMAAMLPLVAMITNVRNWASDRNIIKGCLPIDQSIKLFEEFGELCGNMARGRDVTDDIGDVFVVFIILCAQYNYDLTPHLGEVRLDDPESLVGNDLSHYSDKQVALSLQMALGAACLTCNRDSTVIVLSLLTELCRRYNLSLLEALTHSYDEIKDRKGVMWNGSFVKEADITDEIRAAVAAQ